MNAKRSARREAQQREAQHSARTRNMHDAQAQHHSAQHRSAHTTRCGHGVHCTMCCAQSCRLFSSSSCVVRWFGVCCSHRMFSKDSSFQVTLRSVGMGGTTDIDIVSYCYLFFCSLLFSSAPPRRFPRHLSCRLRRLWLWSLPAGRLKNACGRGKG